MMTYWVLVIDSESVSMKDRVYARFENKDDREEDVSGP
jgi:hypothetical protein